MLLSKYFVWRALVNPKTKSCTVALIMQPPMFSHSFNYSWFMAGHNPVLLGLLLLHWGYHPTSPPPVSLFFSGQAVHQITGAGQGEAASFGTQCNPPVILKRIQRKKYFERHSKRSICFPTTHSPIWSLLPVPSLPLAPTTTPPNWSQLWESDANHLSLLMVTLSLWLYLTFPTLSPAFQETAELPARTGGGRDDNCTAQHQVTVALILLSEGVFKIL